MRYLYYQKILMILNTVSKEKDIALTKILSRKSFNDKAGVCQG